MVSRLLVLVLPPPPRCAAPLVLNGQGDGERNVSPPSNKLNLPARAQGEAQPDISSYKVKVVFRLMYGQRLCLPDKLLNSATIPAIADPRKLSLRRLLSQRAETQDCEPFSMHGTANHKSGSLRSSLKRRCTRRGELASVLKPCCAHSGLEESRHSFLNVERRCRGGQGRRGAACRPRRR